MAKKRIIQIMYILQLCKIRIFTYGKKSVEKRTHFLGFT